MPPELGAVHPGRAAPHRAARQIRQPERAGHTRAGPELLLQLRESGPAAEDAHEQGKRPFPGPVCGTGENLPSPVFCPVQQRGRTGRSLR